MKNDNSIGDLIQQIYAECGISDVASQIIFTQTIQSAALLLIAFVLTCNFLWPHRAAKIKMNPKKAKPDNPPTTSADRIEEILRKKNQP